MRLKIALREIFVAAIVTSAASLAWGLSYGRNTADAAGIIACIFLGLLFALPAWGAYRMVRFAIR